MEGKFVLNFTVAFFLASFLVHLNSATPASTSEENALETSKILCEKTCSKPGWQAKFDKEKSACVCTVGYIDETEKREIKKDAEENGLTLILLKRHRLGKRETVITPIKNENQSKLKKKKKVETPEQNRKDKMLNKAPPVESVNEKTVKDKIKDEVSDNHHIEKIPKAEINKPKDVINEEPVHEKANFKRVAKDHESEETILKNTKLIEPLRKLKLPKISERMSQDNLLKNKLSKPILPPKKVANLLCTPASARHQLEIVKDRISKVIEKTYQPNFHCPQITTDIESLKIALQQAIQRNTQGIQRNIEARHREFDRSKIIEQIREREKERQARMQSRFGHLEFTRPRHRPNLVGGSKIMDKPASSDNKEKKHDVIAEPEGLSD